MSVTPSTKIQWNSLRWHCPTSCLNSNRRLPAVTHRERAILEVAAELEISERTPRHLIPQFADGRLLVAEGSTTNRIYYTPSKPCEERLLAQFVQGPSATQAAREEPWLRRQRAYYLSISHRCAKLSARATLSSGRMRVIKRSTSTALIAPDLRAPLSRSISYII